MKIALIGYGYWGEKIYATLTKIVDVKNIVVFDQYKDISLQSAPSLDSILKDNSITHCIIATPEETHFTLAKKCLENNKHVFVEKPLALRKKDAIKLVTLAKRREKKLYVDYIFLYDPAVTLIKKIIKKGVIGSLKHISSVRHSVHINKPQSTVIDDLLIHDLYLARFFFEKSVTAAATHNIAIHAEKHNQASVLLQYQNQTMSGTYSWIQPTSIRALTFIGSNGSLTWKKDSDYIQIYKKQDLIKEILLPKNVKTPLEKSILHFIHHPVSPSDLIQYIEDSSIIEKLNNQ